MPTKASHLRYASSFSYSLVERMLALHKNLASAKTPQEKESVQRQVESTDGAIDKLVYELYGLSEEEIKIVES